MPIKVHDPGANLHRYRRAIPAAKTTGRRCIILVQLQDPNILRVDCELHDWRADQILTRQVQHFTEATIHVVHLPVAHDRNAFERRLGQR